MLFYLRKVVSGGFILSTKQSHFPLRRLTKCYPLKNCSVALFLLFIIPTVYAQNTEEINAARPNQNATTQNVPQGTVQIETGVLFEREKDNQLTTHRWSYPTTQIRVGIFRRAEINLFHQFIRTQEKPSGETQQVAVGADNIVVGTAVQLSEASGWRPRIGLSVNLTLPTGSEEFRSDKVLPEVLLAFSHALSDKTRLRYTFGWQADDEQTRGNVEYVISFGYQLTDKLSCFAEPYGELENLGTFVLKANGGLAYLLTNHMQVDVAAGTGINADYYFITSGFSIRLPR